MVLWWARMPRSGCNRCNQRILLDMHEEDADDWDRVLMMLMMTMTTTKRRRPRDNDDQDSMRSGSFVASRASERVESSSNTHAKHNLPCARDNISSRVQCAYGGIRSAEHTVLDLVVRASEHTRASTRVHLQSPGYLKHHHQRPPRHLTSSAYL